MAAYRTFTSARATEPDLATLIAQLRALDASAGVQHDPGSPTYIIKKATAWTTPQGNAAQAVIDAAPASSPQLSAQALIDNLSLVDQAIILTLIDQLNTIRAALPVPLGAITPAAAINAIRTKAGTL
jgi:hypothetical protein